MNVTETLRQLLNERGIKWHGVADSTYWGEKLLTKHDGSNPVYKFKANKIANKLSVHLLQVTPEQAIAATLGCMTCKVERHGSLVDWPNMVCWSCSECGFGWHHSINDKQFSYCPNCGRKVKQ